MEQWVQLGSHLLYMAGEPSAIHGWKTAAQQLTLREGRILLNLLVLVMSWGFPGEYNNATSLLHYLVWNMRQTNTRFVLFCLLEMAGGIVTHQNYSTGHIIAYLFFSLCITEVRAKEKSNNTPRHG